MPATQPTPVGAPIWFDLSSSDPDRSAEFYGAIFGWEAVKAPEEFGGYVNFHKNGVQIAGMMKNDPTMGTPDGWTTYLKSEDAQATAAAITEAGGTVVFPPEVVADLGTMAIALDPTGAMIGVWQPGSMAGYGLAHEHGTPVWHELQTRDFAGEVAFYEKAFGWKTHQISDTDEFRYTWLKPGEVQFAGIMDASGYYPEGIPSTWEIYIGVDDVDAAIATAVERGGSVVDAAEDTPFGRLAKIADPTGGSIKISSITPLPAS